jgi:DNA-binding transcriptional regulator YiaG/predicted DNA-binding transcriptional regulator AlpA
MRAMKKFLRFADLKAAGIANSWPMLRHRIERDGFPRGRLLGPNTRAWTEEEIDAWLASRPTAPKPGLPRSRRPGHDARMDTSGNMEAEEFERARLALALTQTEMARLLGIGQRAIRRWEAGTDEVPINISALLRLMIKDKLSAAEVYKLATGEDW